MVSIVSSDSFYYVNCSKNSSQSELNHADNYSLYENSITPLNLSCSSILIAISEQTNYESNGSQQANEKELSNTDQSEQEEETINYNERLYHHCIKPCNENCPMFPVATAKQATNQRQLVSKPTFSSPLHFYNPQQQTTSPYSYYWDHNTGSYQLMLTQPSQSYGYSKRTCILKCVVYSQSLLR